MFCIICGKELPENAVACPACGAYQTSGAAPAIPNHLVGAILSTLFCCLPFGIVSIAYAANVNSKIAADDIEGAKKASENAKTWMIVAMVCGLIPVFIGFFLCLSNAAASRDFFQGFFRGFFEGFSQGFSQSLSIFL